MTTPHDKPALSDEEVICSAMEARVSLPNIWVMGVSKGGWWFFRQATGWVPINLTLDRLHIVEERLSEEQWGTYADAIADGCGDSLLEESKALIHASAEAKIRALAAVLREAR